ncbi:hypothetical protein QFZ83_001482 [Variovorax sp. W1I1]|nr:hypothetical protein [Variovorax sp. W1I1]
MHARLSQAGAELVHDRTETETETETETATGIHHEWREPASKACKSIGRLFLLRH